MHMYYAFKSIWMQIRICRGKIQNQQERNECWMQKRTGYQKLNGTIDKSCSIDSVLETFERRDGVAVIFQIWQNSWSKICKYCANKKWPKWSITNGQSFQRPVEMVLEISSFGYLANSNNKNRFNQHITFSSLLFFIRFVFDFFWFFFLNQPKCVKNH